MERREGRIQKAGGGGTTKQSSPWNILKHCVLQMVFIKVNPFSLLPDSLPFPFTLLKSGIYLHNI